MGAWTKIKNRLQESGFPTVNQQKCIRHGRLFSNCVNCLDACPDEAISLVDNQIQLNASDCRDCGLCAAACPEQAIEVKHRVNRVVYQEKPLALIACIKTVKTADKINPQLHCIHELNSAALADLYLSNTRTIVATTADCQHCELNRHDRFTESLDLFNVFLGSMSLPPVRHFSVKQKAFDAIEKKSSDIHHRQKLSRRNFLKKAVVEAQTAVADSKVDDQTENNLSVSNQFHAAFSKLDLSPVNLLNIELDGKSCTACMDCCRVCPHEALLLESDGDEGSINIRPQFCTGCMACVDICRSRSITVKPEVSQGESVLPLISRQCVMCGVEFHRLKNQTGNSHYCSICESRLAQKEQRLFQVYD